MMNALSYIFILVLPVLTTAFLLPAARTTALERTVCELKLGTLTCPTGLIIQVDSVLYGRTQNSVCNSGNGNFQNLNCRSTQKSTDAVVNRCQSRTTCLLQANNNVLGEDPCPGESKYLQVRYQCVYSIGGRQTPPTTLPTTPTTPTTPPQANRQTLPPAILPIGIGGSRTNNQTAIQQCNEYLVSGPRRVPDAQLTASSTLGVSNNAHRGRLYMGIDKYPTGFSLEGAWTADSSDTKPWIQVKMNWLTVVQGVVTQGRHVNPDTSCCQEWVTRFTVQTSVDGINWDIVQDKFGRDKIFVGNTDTDTVITNMFDCTVIARFLRIRVIDYVSRPSLRFDVIGCPTNTADLGTCPPHWKERPGSNKCYYISDQRDQKTWEYARQMCKHNQGDLVKIDSLQEKVWLRSEMIKLQSSQKLSEWWVGLSNIPRRDNKNFTWEDGSQLDTTVLQWEFGNPNNAGGQEHCGQYQLFQDSVNDKNCGASKPFICELNKYWKGYANVPSIVTRQPTLGTTIAPPIAVTYKPPVPIGGHVVTTKVNTFPRGCKKPMDCYTGIAWGDYQSCTGCHLYLTCSPAGAIDRPCPVNLKYDSNLKACWPISSTCSGP